MVSFLKRKRQTQRYRQACFPAAFPSPNSHKVRLRTDDFSALHERVQDICFAHWFSNAVSQTPSGYTLSLSWPKVAAVTDPFPTPPGRESGSWGLPCQIASPHQLPKPFLPCRCPVFAHVLALSPTLITPLVNIIVLSLSSHQPSTFCREGTKL